MNRSSAWSGKLEPLHDIFGDLCTTEVSHSTGNDTFDLELLCWQHEEIDWVSAFNELIDPLKIDTPGQVKLAENVTGSSARCSTTELFDRDLDTSGLVDLDVSSLAGLDPSGVIDLDPSGLAGFTLSDMTEYDLSDQTAGDFSGPVTSPCSPQTGAKGSLVPISPPSSPCRPKHKRRAPESKKHEQKGKSTKKLKQVETPSPTEYHFSRQRSIERTYRDKIATNLDRLRACVPSILDDGKDSLSGEEVYGLMTTRKRSKATTISKATEFIEHMKEQHVLMQARAEMAESTVLQLETENKRLLLGLLNQVLMGGNEDLPV